MPENQYRCQQCGEMFQDQEALQRHNTQRHNPQQQQQQQQPGNR